MEKAITRIMAKDGRTPIGIGFLIDHQHILTCAHVVTTSLGLPLHTPQPDQSILIEFPLLDANHRKQRMTAQVAAWRAYQDKPGYAGDIACLRIDGALPVGAGAVPVKIKASLWKQEFRAYGVPAAYPQGIWTSGEILGRQSNGYFQVETTRAAGYQIQPGFSGGPVWSDQMQAVVAMLALADMSGKAQAAFAIPARILLEVIGNLTPSVSQASKVIAQLGDLIGMDQMTLSQLSQNSYQSASHPQADVDDLLESAILQIWHHRFDLAHALLTRLLTRDPLHEYGRYLLGLCLLEGKRPEQLQNFNKARTIHETLEPLTRVNAPAHIHLLHFYLKKGYFMRNGFTAIAGDLRTYEQTVQSAVRNQQELDALAHVLPDIRQLPQWKILNS